MDCIDCLKTYQPYRYVIALLRVLMYGFSDWWEFEDEWDIEEQFREHCRDPYVRRKITNKTRTYSRDDSFVEDFNFYYQYLENKRRKNISATFLCFDCEKYYCTNCIGKHTGHFTFCKDDKYNTSEWRRICAKMLEKLNGEGNQKLENMKRERVFQCDVDVRCGFDKLGLRDILHNILDRYELNEPLTMELGLDRDFRNTLWIQDLHILNDNKRWLVADDDNTLKIFNINDNKMTRRIKLSDRPYGITEIPSKDPLQSLISVSFPYGRQICIVNIHTTPAQVVSSINVQGECYDLAYCNDKLITLCGGYLHGAHSIHVMAISGKIINIIILHNLPGFKLDRLYSCSMSVHSESETIYVCHWSNPSCVISLSLDGQVLHSVTFTDLEPGRIHVDNDQNVYVMSNRLPIYKLSADLTHREKIIDEDVCSIPSILVMTIFDNPVVEINMYSIRAMRFHFDKVYLASDEGHVYIIQYDMYGQQTVHFDELEDHILSKTVTPF